MPSRTSLHQSLSESISRRRDLLWFVQKFTLLVWFLAPGSFEIRLFPVWTRSQVLPPGFALAHREHKRKGAL